MSKQRLTPVIIAAIFSWSGCDGSANGPGESGDTDTDTDSDADTDTDSDADTDTGDEPFGEIGIEQVYLPAFNLGEAILIVGPDGTSVLVDTANDSHSSNLLEVIERRLEARSVDWVILTHYHNDHIGGFDNLFTPTLANGNDPVVIEKGLVSRGLVDIATDMVGVEDFDEMCGGMTAGELAVLRFDLCEGTQYDCGGSETGVPWAADGCDGLLKGDLEDPSDDDDGLLSFIDLGGGARLHLFQANGHVALDGEVVSAESEGLSIGHGATYPENARSIGGAIRWGAFTYLFNGDTPGTTPDMEGFIASRSASLVIESGGELLIPQGEGDVMHMSHHGLDTSTSQPWIDWLMPDDGHSRNTCVGTTSMYYQSPAQGLLDRVAPRLVDGYIWTTELGILPGSHPRLKVADGAIEVLVETGGVSYQISTLNAGGQSDPETYVSSSD